jgi:hypothetical protein
MIPMLDMWAMNWFHYVYGYYALKIISIDEDGITQHHSIPMFEWWEFPEMAHPENPKNKS